MPKFIQERVARVPSQNQRVTGGYLELALGGNHVLSLDSAQFQVLDPGAAHRDVFLPDATYCQGGWFWIRNIGGGNNLVIKNGVVTVATVSSGAGWHFVSNGIDWSPA